MALSVTEATAVNTVLNGLVSMDLDEIPEDFSDALLHLAHSAHKTLVAGWTRAQVLDCWPTVTQPDHPCAGVNGCVARVLAPGGLCRDCQVLADDASNDARQEIDA